MASKWLILFIVIILECLPTISAIPKCDYIRILCNRHDRDCCIGPCCSFFPLFQVPAPITPPADIPDSVLFTPPSNLPKIGELCTSEYPEEYQCDNGGIIGSTRCKFDGSYDQNGRLLGKCKINEKFSGCTTDTDCYKTNNICNNAICEPLTFVPSPSMPDTAGAVASDVKPANPAVPVVNVYNAEHIEENFDDEQIEVKGGTFKSELKVPLSKQAKLMGGLIAGLLVICAMLKCCRSCWNKKDGKEKDKKMPDMTDYEVDDMDAEWSNDETDEEQPELVCHGRRSQIFNVDALVHAPTPRQDL